MDIRTHSDYFLHNINSLDV